MISTLNRQYLLEKGERMEIVSGLCGLQAQFANNPAYSLRIRARDFSEDSWGDGLLKVWTNRGTIHVIREDELGLFLSAKGKHGPWQDSWWKIPVEVKPFWSDFIREKVSCGVDEREALKAECRRKGMEEELVQRIFHGWGGLIQEMCDRGLIAYVPGTEKRFFLPKEPGWMEQEEARLILLRRYFLRFGLASLEDCAAFFGYRMTELRELLRRGALPLKQEECYGKQYFYLGELYTDGSVPSCIYLSGFDQMVLGYKDRERFMDQRDKRLVTNQAGIVYPTIMYHGRIRARWKKEPGKLKITPFHPISGTAKRQMAVKGRKLFSEEKLQVEFLSPCEQ